jgi:hypothetical protein
MAFEMKYDRDGNPLKQPELDPMNQPKIEQPEVHAQADQVESVEEAQITSELETLLEKQPEPVQNNPIKRPSGPQESWKQLREKALAAEKRSTELEAALAQASKQSQQAPQEEEEEEISVDADALVEGKHLSKVNKHIKKLEAQLHQYQQQTVLSATEMRLKTQYPDFDSIVSKDNLESLRLAYPEIAQTINSSSDLYSKAVSAYTMIKKLGINEESETFDEEKAVIHKNANKPKPSAVLKPQQGDSPLTKANAFAQGPLTDDLKAAMLKEMNQYRNR